MSGTLYSPFKLDREALNCYTYTHHKHYEIQIQVLLGHSSSKKTEIYIHVATITFKTIKNPLV